MLPKWSPSGAFRTFLFRLLLSCPLKYWIFRFHDYNSFSDMLPVKSGTIPTLHGPRSLVSLIIKFLDKYKLLLLFPLSQTSMVTDGRSNSITDLGDVNNHSKVSNILIKPRRKPLNHGRLAILVYFRSVFSEDVLAQRVLHPGALTSFKRPSTILYWTKVVGTFRVTSCNKLITFYHVSKNFCKTVKDYFNLCMKGLLGRQGVGPQLLNISMLCFWRCVYKLHRNKY